MRIAVVCSALVGALWSVGCGGSPALPEESPDAGGAVDAGTGLGAPCSRAGELGCQGVGQKLLLLCDGTRWISNGVCSGDLVCDPRPGPTLGSCQTPACKPGVTSCEGASLATCTADLLTTEKTECASAEYCRHSVGGRCAKCLSWDALCDGATLLLCAPDRQSLAPRETCASAALCNATLGKCVEPSCVANEYRCNSNLLEKCKEGRNGWDLVEACAEGKCDATAKACAAPCTAGEYRCSGDVLETCNTGGTAFDPVKVCGVGLCDAAGKECDECTSGAVGCVDATPRACDSSGHWKLLTACASPTPACVAGVCTSVFTKTVVTFPSAGSTLNTTSTSTTLGIGGGAKCWQAGSYVEEKFARAGSVTQLDLFTKMSDLTTASATCPPVTLSFAVKLNGVQVGTYSWLTGSTSDKSISKVFTFSSIAPSSGMFTIRYEALNAVCSTGGGYSWYPGGSVTLGGL